MIPVRFRHEAYSLLLGLPKRPSLLRLKLLDLLECSNRPQLLQPDLSIARRTEKSARRSSTGFTAFLLPTESKHQLTDQSCVLNTLCTLLPLPKKFFAPVCIALEYIL